MSCVVIFRCLFLIKTDKISNGILLEIVGAIAIVKSETFIILYKYSEFNSNPISVCSIPSSSSIFPISDSDKAVSSIVTPFSFFSNSLKS